MVSTSSTRERRRRSRRGRNESKVDASGCFPSRLPARVWSEPYERAFRQLGGGFLEHNTIG
jgi:hypothetical protein